MEIGTMTKSSKYPCEQNATADNAKSIKQVQASVGKLGKGGHEDHGAKFRAMSVAEKKDSYSKG
jgi:hypothetical protein